MRAIFKGKKLICFADEQRVPEVVTDLEQNGYRALPVKICPCCKGSGYEIQLKTKKKLKRE